MQRGNAEPGMHTCERVGRTGERLGGLALEAARRRQCCLERRLPTRHRLGHCEQGSGGRKETDSAAQHTTASEAVHAGLARRQDEAGLGTRTCGRGTRAGVNLRRDSTGAAQLLSRCGRQPNLHRRTCRSRKLRRRLLHWAGRCKQGNGGVG